MRLLLTWSPIPRTLAPRWMGLCWMLDHNCVREVQRGDEINNSPFSFNSHTLGYDWPDELRGLSVLWIHTFWAMKKDLEQDRSAVKYISLEWKTRSLLVQWVPLPGCAQILTRLYREEWCRYHGADGRWQRLYKHELMWHISSNPQVPVLHKIMHHSRNTLPTTRPIGTSNSNSNANHIVMNTPQQLDDNILVATACVRAALNVVPRIVGPKKQWGLWMHDQLQSELVSHAVFGIEMEHSLIVIMFPEPAIDTKCKRSILGPRLLAASAPCLPATTDVAWQLTHSCSNKSTQTIQESLVWNSWM